MRLLGFTQLKTKTNLAVFIAGETRREGSNDEPTAPDADVDTSDAATKDSDKDNT